MIRIREISVDPLDYSLFFSCSFVNHLFCLVFVW